MLAGEIGKPHGISGEVYVMAISDDPRRFAPGSRLSHSDGRELVVEATRQHRERLLVKFEGVASRTEAEELRGPLYIPGDDVRELEADEFWSYELVGLDVYLGGSQERLGTIEEVVSRPAQDLLSVGTSRGPRLVPLVKDIVTSIDVERGRVEIEPPAGLLD